MGEEHDSAVNAARLGGMGEWFASGLVEAADASPMRRWSLAYRRWLENQLPVPYEGGQLYPTGPRLRERVPRLLHPDYSFTWALDRAACAARIEEFPVDEEAARDQREALTALLHVIEGEMAHAHAWQTTHTVGGRGYTHSIPNYGRVIREGLNEHGRRIEAGLARAAEQNDADGIDFYTGLQDLLEGIRAWHGNVLVHLAQQPEAEHLAKLRAALERVPFEPARTFHEALVAYNVVYYLDGGDNPGRIDQELYPYYRADIDKGVLTREEAVALMAAFTDNVCACAGWSAAIGGTAPDGEPAYNDLTRICLETVRGKFRPNYELRVREDMPDDVWDAALEALASGCGQPALYNEEGYLASLRSMNLGLSEEDLSLWNGGGCTETMVHGCSNVGSLDAGILLPLILEETLYANLAAAESFDALKAEFFAAVSDTVDEIVRDLNGDQERKARFRPQPMRSLLIDDCIERGADFNAGGARYNWSVVNVAGVSDVADSLAAVREAVFETQEMSGAELLALMGAGFEGHETERRRLMACPRFGNDDPRVDELAAEVAGFTFREFLKYEPRRGGRFLPSCIMFETYGPEGARVGATPDGRLGGQPIADSMGPHQGRDTHGPTAMLRSVTRLPLQLAAGTPVVNIRFAPSMFASGENRRRVRELLRTYFRMGGMQIQVSVVDQEVLQDAIRHPERHEDLIVRIGGYSTYFNRLSEQHKHAVLERAAHGL